MFITKKHIPRRTFLQGAGVTLALPLLESMVPAGTALAQTAAAPTPGTGMTVLAGGITAIGMPATTRFTKCDPAAELLAATPLLVAFACATRRSAVTSPFSRFRPTMRPSVLPA